MSSNPQPLELSERKGPYALLAASGLDGDCDGLAQEGGPPGIRTTGSTSWPGLPFFKSGRRTERYVSVRVQVAKHLVVSVDWLHPRKFGRSGSLELGGREQSPSFLYRSKNTRGLQGEEC